MAYVGETGAGDGVSGLGIRALLRARSWRYSGRGAGAVQALLRALYGDLSWKWG